MDTRKAKTFERQIIEVFGRKKAKRPKQDDQNRLRSAMHKWEEPYLIIIMWFMNCKFRLKIYLINHVGAEALTTGGWL